ncbi:hypothetical protein DI392_14160 [Vibrio albus]|uniref:Uncharacterized protein n=1 Tax=Vibrio albus TaxID=2200953 RepID=A0A2U3B767_9VIBR|nr:hypothetical protein [Vibrio albus]PWI32565.1 hypothetical protein DI392_14160 [Vibrio albus]
MDLVVEPTGEIFGTYSSTTGASGRYLVYGYCSPDNPTNEQGQPVALSITWRPFDSQTENDSWHWVSTYCGQLLPITNTDEPGSDNDDRSSVLSVINSLVATTRYNGAALGDYIDKLAFHKQDDVAQFQPDDIEEMFHSHSRVENPINGTWKDTVNDLQLTLSVVNEQNGLIYAELTQNNQTLTLKGFTDTLSLPYPKRQSITLSGIRKDSDSTPVSLSGYLDQQNEQLILTYWSAYGTPEAEAYLQTNACSTLFDRIQK